MTRKRRPLTVFVLHAPKLGPFFHRPCINIIVTFRSASDLSNNKVYNQYSESDCDKFRHIVFGVWGPISFLIIEEQIKMVEPDTNSYQCAEQNPDTFDPITQKRPLTSILRVQYKW